MAMNPKSSNEAQSVSVIISDTHEAPSSVLEITLEKSGFWDYLNRASEQSPSNRKALRILIKPDMEFYDFRASTGTDPRLIEHLIDILFVNGYENVIVADGLSSSDNWLDNRSVMVLADLAGYRYETEQGHSYEIVDLGEDLVEYEFPEGSILKGAILSETWIKADFRISFAKNKTDEENRYALGVQNVMGVFPLRDKTLQLGNSLKAEDVCVDLLKHTEIHFAIIDALVSNHGSIGSREVNPLDTGTIIASRSLLLADWIAALKMGLDPYTSKLNAAALRAIGLPKQYEISGNLDPYDGWKNVPLLLADVVQKRNESPMINRIIRPWLQNVNKELFPFKNPVDEQVNAVLTAYLGAVDEHPLAYLVTVALNYMLASMNSSLEIWQTLYDKDRLYRQKVPLGIELENYNNADFKAIVDYMMPLATIASHTRPDQNGLRWRYIDESVLFEFKRFLPIAYTDFVEKVDICHAVQMMYDNIGGAYVPIKRDKQGRVIQQAERDIYLPQPNWMILFGGQTIDVVKLESIQYTKSQQQIFWKTVSSPNDSAEFDDGIVTFRKEAGGTSITIVARQKFTLPLIFQTINIDYLPYFKDAIISNAYTMFFTRTTANYEAAYEQRNPLIGRDWKSHNREDDTPHPLQKISQPLSDIPAVFSKALGKAQVKNGVMDDKGYTHFDGESSSNDQIVKVSGEIIADLIQAFVKDLLMFSNRPDGNPK
jgi:uncharacterized protein (DUF362 family)